MEVSTLLQLAVMVALGAPAMLLATLIVALLIQRSPREVFVAVLTQTSLWLSFFATMVALVLFFASGAKPTVASYGSWFSAGKVGFKFDFLIDGWSLGFATLLSGICVIVAAFSGRYLHRETGYHRYFVLLALFVVGMLLVALAGSIEVLFAGWELIGLSSALLVGFFHERAASVANAFRVMVVYRVGDTAMLSAAVLVHHWAGSGSLSLLFSGHPETSSTLSLTQATVIAVLLIAAVAAKSALLPFSGWLPRAMEGPTPSSAVYYGALSVHAGCFLLLRAQPLLEQSPLARGLAVLAGASTALYATLTARVQTDVKSALAYASLTQVGFIVVEIALGLQIIAFVHMIGNACLRLLQFLSASNALHDLRSVENALGTYLNSAQVRDIRTKPAAYRRLYLFALERGFIDPLMECFIVIPFTRIAAFMDHVDRVLSGDHDTLRAKIFPKGNHHHE